jgi:hypothetical protein
MAGFLFSLYVLLSVTKFSQHYPVLNTYDRDTLSTHVLKHVHPSYNDHNYSCVVNTPLVFKHQSLLVYYHYHPLLKIHPGQCFSILNCQHHHSSLGLWPWYFPHCTLLLLAADDIEPNPGPVSAGFCNVRSIRNKTGLITEYVKSSELDGFWANRNSPQLNRSPQPFSRYHTLWLHSVPNSMHWT